MSKTVILGTARTPVGKLGGSLASLKAVRHLTPAFDLPTLVEELQALCRGGRSAASLSKGGVKELIARIEPAFARTHIESEKSLDQRV